MYNVLIAEHHQLIGEAIARMLEDDPSIRVCHRSVNTEALCRAAREHRPDVVLIDLHLPPAGGLDGIRRLLLSMPKLRVICMGLNRHGPYPLRVIEHGARGLLSMDCTAEELLEAIRTVAAGGVHIGAELAQAVLRSGLGCNQQPIADLSARELAVMTMLCNGKRPKEISARLCISAKTVSTYRSRVCRKLGVSNDVELTHLSLEHGLIENRYCS
ncbi:MAG: two-component system invasion response regulator UvrY [Gammaproteobacteria bacterium]|jgi:two-component system invasion response regulator UvrY